MRLRLESFIPLISVFLYFPAAHAQFSPTVGDSVVYRVTDEEGSWHQRNSLSGHDPKTDHYWVTITDIWPDGKEDELIQQEQDGELIRANYISALDDECQSRDGEMGTMTVPAGTFTACKVVFALKDSTYIEWLAAGVPFGVIRAEFIEAATSKTFLLYELEEPRRQP